MLAEQIATFIHGMKILLSFLILAQFCCSVEAKVLTIGLGNFKPLFAEPNEPALFKDLLDGVFRYMPEYKINYHYMLSNARLLKELRDGRVDGSANIFSQNEFEGCLTNPTFRYADVAISAKKDQYQINKLADLKGKSLVTYQRAITLLGEEFKSIANTAPYYREIAQPAEQAILLAKGFADLSIGDKYIFLYSIRENTEFDVNQFEFHPIFPMVYSSVGFRSKQHCDEFNAALRQFQLSGEYEHVYQKHLKSLGYKESI